MPPLQEDLNILRVPLPLMRREVLCVLQSGGAWRCRPSMVDIGGR